MIFEINQIEDSKLEKAYGKSMQELGSFFELGWKENRPKVFLVPDRKTIDELNGKKTEDWKVGWTNNNIVYILIDKNYESESNHKYSDEEYFMLLKHELAHCFSYVVSNYSKLPRWLSEGISIYLSGQNKLKIKPEKLCNFLKSHYKNEEGLHEESGFAVEFLVKKYGKTKLINLLKDAGKVKSEAEFSELFKQIYGFYLRYENFKVL